MFVIRYKDLSGSSGSIVHDAVFLTSKDNQLALTVLDRGRLNIIPFLKYEWVEVTSEGTVILSYPFVGGYPYASE